MSVRMPMLSEAKARVYLDTESSASEGEVSHVRALKDKKASDYPRRPNDKFNPSASR